LAKTFAGAGEAALDRADGTAELACRVFATKAFEAAEDQRGAEVGGEAMDLVVEDRLAVVGRAIRGVDGDLRGGRALVALAAATGGAGARGGADGDLMEPGADGVGGSKGASAAGEDEEGRLERVVGVVLLAEDPAAGAEDHRAVAVDEDAECGLGRGARGVEEAGEEFGVGARTEVAVLEEVTDESDGRGPAGGGHRAVSPAIGGSFNQIMSWGGPVGPTFPAKRIAGRKRGRGPRFREGRCGPRGNRGNGLLAGGGVVGVSSARPRAAAARSRLAHEVTACTLARYAPLEAITQTSRIP
jgi:hypothetical protein